MNVLGAVNDQLEPLVSLRLRHPNSQVVQQVFALVDTGFTDLLCISTALQASLGLKRIGVTPYRLAGGHAVRLDIVVLEVEWLGQWRKIHAVVNGGDVLLGMRALKGGVLNVQGRSGGRVTFRV